MQRTQKPVCAAAERMVEQFYHELECDVRRRTKPNFLPATMWKKASPVAEMFTAFDVNAHSDANAVGLDNITKLVPFFSDVCPAEDIVQISPKQFDVSNPNFRSKMQCSNVCK